MNKVIISSDSTCDLSAALVERYGVEVIPLYVNLGEQSFKDGLELKADEIYGYVAENHQLPKTAAATIPDYVEKFSQWVGEGYDVVHFNISSSMSCSYQNARLAAEEVEGNVYVIDSANLSTGSGLLVLDACDLRNEGKAAEEIVAEIEKRISQVRASFVVDTLDYLRMGGRCSAVAALGANLLKLHPRIYVEGGKMSVAEKYRGSIDNVMVQYVRQMLGRDGDKLRKNRCFVTHTKCNAETVEKVKALVAEAGVFEEILETEAGCVITSHCGAGTLGILYEVTE